MADTAEQRAWVSRVLGVALAPVATTAARTPATTQDTADRPRLLPIWVEAKDSVDEQIEALRGVLAAQGRPGLRMIAEAGLPGVTAGASVGMMAALRELDAAPGSAKAQAKLTAAAAAFRTFLAGDVAAFLEEVPLGNGVKLRERFGQALDRIETLAAA
jgi:hypothetical protein